MQLHVRIALRHQLSLLTQCGQLRQFMTPTRTIGKGCLGHLLIEIPKCLRTIALIGRYRCGLHPRLLIASPTLDEPPLLRRIHMPILQSLPDIEGYVLRLFGCVSKVTLGRTG